MKRCHYLGTDCFSFTASFHYSPYMLVEGIISRKHRTKEEVLVTCGKLLMCVSSFACSVHHFFKTDPLPSCSFVCNWCGLCYTAQTTYPPRGVWHEPTGATLFPKILTVERILRRLPRKMERSEPRQSWSHYLSKICCCLFLIRIPYSPLFNSFMIPFFPYVAAYDWMFLGKLDDESNFVENQLFNLSLPLRDRIIKAMTESTINVYEPVGSLWRYLLFAVSGYVLDSQIMRIATWSVHVFTGIIILPYVIEKLMAMVELIENHNPSRTSEEEKSMKKRTLWAPRDQQQQLVEDVTATTLTAASVEKKITAYFEINGRKYSNPTRSAAPIAKISALDRSLGEQTGTMAAANPQDPDSVEEINACELKKRLTCDSSASKKPRREDIILGVCFLYTMHPICVESIGWASAGNYVVAFLLSLMSLDAFLTFLKLFVAISAPSPKKTCFMASMLLASSLFYLAAVLSKAVSVTIPVVHMFLLGYLISKRLNSETIIFSQVIRELKTFSAIAGFLGVVSGSAFLLIKSANTEGTYAYNDTIYLTVFERLLKLPLVLAKNIEQLAFPVYLTPHYRVALEDLSLGSPVLISKTIGLIWTFYAVNKATLENKRSYVSRLSIVALIFCLLNLPTYGLIQHGAVLLTADRYLYLSGALFLYPLTKYLTQASLDMKQLSVGFVSVYFVFAVITYHQIQAWQTERTFLQRAVQIDPADWRTIDLYADSLFYNEQFEQAKEFYRLSGLYAPSPRHSVKSALFHAKNQIILGHRDSGCLIYAELYEKLRKEKVTNGFVLNNHAICSLLEAYNAEDKSRAMMFFELALTDDKLPAHRREKITQNLDSLKVLSPGDQFQGVIVY